MQDFSFKKRPEGSGRYAIRAAILSLAVPLLLLAACDNVAGNEGESNTEAVKQRMTTLGAHALVFQRIGGGLNTVQTPGLSTAESGSTMLISIGRGQVAAFDAPTDNMNNAPFTQLGETHRYTNWSDSGTALYALENAGGGDGHVFQTTTPPEDEVTLAAVEILGSHVEDAAWREVLYPGSFGRIRRAVFSENSVTSATVETSGPATLVAFWWGDAGVEGDKSAEPSHGFELIDAVLEPGALVQCAVAVRHVTEAGHYDVTWNSSPLQGAQLWLVAVADQ